MTRLVSMALGLVGCAVVAAAPPAPFGPPPGGNRFLFVVDMSSSMSKLALASRQTVFDMIYFGVNEQMRAGDTFGLWTFDQEPHTGIFPMQIWHPDKTLDLASRTAKFLKEQPHKKKARVEPTLAKVYAVIAMVRDVNVFIITDADTPVAGTPFDKDLNSQCAQKASARRMAKQPFVITLAARGGTLVQASVTLPGEAITLPPPPPSVEIAKAEAKPSGESPKPTAAAGESETVSATNLTAASSAQLAAPPTNRASIIITNTARVAPKKVIEIRTLTNAAAKSPTQAAPGSSSAEPAAEKSESTAVDIMPTSTVATNLPPAENLNGMATPADSTPLADTHPSPLPGTAAATKEIPPASPNLPPSAIPVAARETLPPTPPAAITPLATNSLIAAAAPKEAGTGHRTLFAVGTLLLSVALGLVFLSLRRLRQARQPSFISRSLEEK